MRFPVFWLAVAYASGLALYADVEASPRGLVALATLALLGGTAALRRRWLRLTLALALAGFFLAGGATIRFEEAAVPPTRVDRLVAAGQLDLSEAVRVTGWLRRAPQNKPFATNYELELETLESGGRAREATGGVRLSYFLAPDELAPPMPDLHYGDRIEVLARLHEPVNHQNPGSFDWRAYLARQEIFLEGSLRSPLLLTKLPGQRGHRALGWIEDLRTHLLAQLDSGVPPRRYPDHNAALRAMLLGDTALLAHRLAESFRLSGAYHVLVVSGLNVAILAVFLFWLLRRLHAREWLATLVTMAALVFYLLLVEDRPPIERAVWMVGLYLVARLLFREVHLANPLALAALLILFLHPLWLSEPSSHLSFGAVLMIAFFAVPWIERTSTPYREALRFLDAPERDEQSRPVHLLQFRHDVRATADLLSGAVFWTAEKERAARRLLTGLIRAGLRVWEFFVLSFAIQLGFLLLGALYFNRIVWVGLLTNILVVPLVGWVVPLGLAALGAALLWPAAGALVAVPVRWLVGAMLAVVNTLGTGSLSYGIPPPPLWVVWLYVAALAGLAAAVVRQQRQRWAALLLAAVMVVVVTHPFPPQLDKAALEITALDVGQGDALFLAFPSGETWLIDAGRGPLALRHGYRVGEDIGENVVKPYLRARGLKRLGRVWLTHAHQDHMGGLGAVLEEFPVASFDAGPNADSPAYRELREKVQRRGIPLALHRAGERFAVGDVEVEVLWPSREHQPGPEPSNNDSVVLRLCRGATCALLPGDIEAPVEKELAARQTSMKAALLKVPHHGGRDSASEAFLEAVAPEVAIVSVGATNPFGHPYPSVLERLHAAARRTYRTDRDGSVTARLGKDGWETSSFAEQERRAPYPSLWAKVAACARRMLSLESR